MTAIVIIGSTGSIGKSALEVLESHFPDVQIKGLSAGRNIGLLAEQIVKYRPEIVSVSDSESADKLRRLVSESCPEILTGVEALKRMAKLESADTVLVCVSGALGVWPAWEAVRAKKNLALATKEALVLLGNLLREEADRTGARIVPVDSEHSALFQLMRGTDPLDIRSIWLGASGGPFRNSSIEDMQKVTPEQALDHPVWSMGPKITIDSATLMNKGLEIIEARWLFDIEPENINAVIHPQGLVHAMVELIDGSILMHAGMPDMKSPIAYALSHPRRVAEVLPRLDLAKVGKLLFEKPDYEKFPCLNLAKKALRMGGTAPAALNAADEIAVDAFLKRKISFTAIPRLIERVLDRHDTKAVTSPEDAVDADICAREAARGILKNGEVN